MSPHAVNSFVTDLVEMAKAMEELPNAKARVTELEGDNETLRQRVADREERILNLKGNIDSLQFTIRSLEVARDDAELRFLESDEQMGKIAKAFQVALEAMDHTDKVITTAEEVLHPIATVPEPIVQASPIADTGQSSGPQAEPNTVDGFNAQWDKIEQGQSESHPTTMEVAPVGLTESSVHHTEETVSTPNSGPYSGLRYINVPGWVSRSDWLAGGGTDADYDWREGNDNRYRA